MPATAATVTRLVEAELARLMPSVIRASAASRSIAASAREVLGEYAQMAVDDAVADGRIAETDRSEWAQNLTEAPRFARQVLASMPVGVHVSAADQAAEDALYLEMFPPGS